MMRLTLLLLLALSATQSAAYCIYNQTDRPLAIEQEPHPDKLRDGRGIKATLAPGASQCCAFHKLDCNPRGRQNSVVNFSMTLPGEPVYECGFPEGAHPNVKVTGSGTVRVQRNPRKSAYPYIVRIRTHDGQNLTGPKGVVCPEARSKGNR